MTNTRSVPEDLPNRRVEAWKYSDLRAALHDRVHILRPPGKYGRDIIERLAPGTQSIDIPAGETRAWVERMEDDRYLDARAYDFTLGEGASFTRVVLQHGAAEALSIARVRLAANAVFRQCVFAFGGRLARIETHIAIEGEGAVVELNGVYMVGAGRHADLTSVVTHNAPNAATRQLVKGVAKQGGRGVFQGKILVAHGAQKTDARQHHSALMLEEGAEIDAKPELEIYADDVQCAHGNAIGGLDDAQLFYARSRGIAEAEARALLVESFLIEAVPEHLNDDVRAEIVAGIGGWLRA